MTDLSSSRLNTTLTSLCSICRHFHFHSELLAIQMCSLGSQQPKMCLFTRPAPEGGKDADASCQTPESGATGVDKDHPRERTHKWKHNSPSPPALSAFRSRTDTAPGGVLCRQKLPGEEDSLKRSFSPAREDFRNARAVSCRLCLVPATALVSLCLA